MAKKIFLIRHAKQDMKEGVDDIWQFKAKLTTGTEEQIKVAANYFANQQIEFSAFWHSPLTRSKQTCISLRKSMGSRKPIGLNKNLGPGRPNEWNLGYRLWKNMQDDPKNLPKLTTVDLVHMWPELCEREGKQVFEAIKQIASKLKDGQSAAAICHNPLMRLAQAVATGRSYESPDPAYCQALCFTFEGKKFIGCSSLLY